jgi:hypothetical protein
LWWSVTGTRDSSAGDSLIVAAFRGSSSAAQVVVADDAFVLIQVLLDRRFTLQEYENLAYLQMPQLVNKCSAEHLWTNVKFPEMWS